MQGLTSIAVHLFTKLERANHKVHKLEEELRVAVGNISSAEEMGEYIEATQEAIDFLQRKCKPCNETYSFIERTRTRKERF